MEQLQLPGVDWIEYDASITLRSMRYFAPVEDEYDSIDDAISAAFYQVEYNTAAPHELVNARGEVVMDHDALSDAIMRYDA